MGDFTRDSNDPRKHYSGVLQQQGRVQLDADSNEQLAIQLHRTEIEAVDVIGHCGVPKEGGGFLVGLTPNALDLTISAGRIYVEGLLCELDATPVPITFVPNTTHKATVESLYADGIAFRTGQWVEISAAQKAGKQILRIVGADVQQGTLTFDSNLSNFKNAGTASIRRVTTLLTQPDYPGPAFTAPFDIASANQGPSSPPSPLTSPPRGDGLYIAYIDAWKREITALDDPHLREVALGGPDTATRLKNVWQVKLLAVRPRSPLSIPATAAPLSSPPDCESEFAEWDELTAKPSGLMNARTAPPQDLKDPCLLPPSAGYTRLENQLYRVEVQRGGDRQTATFKWSRDNAVVRTNITDASKAASGILVVADVGRDEVLSFAGGQWVEITDEESILSGKPRRLVRIDKVDPTTREITLASPPADSLAGKANLQLVRWDQTGASSSADGVAMTNDWLDLEAGVQVQFSDGTYRAGDYWLIPARTATGEIEWPPFAVPNADPAPQPPLAIRHHFCRLALVSIKGGIINLTDCRDLFPPLTHICAEDVCFDNTTCSLPGATNVQEALDLLCQRGDHSPGIHVTAVDLLAGNQLRNDTNVFSPVLAKGIRITCDHDLLATSVEQKPTCYVTLYLPFPFNRSDAEFWQANNIGCQPLILRVPATVDRNMILWKPNEVTAQWLSKLFEMMRQKETPLERLLVTLTLKGNFIWAKDDPNLYLDGQAFGFQATSPATAGPAAPNVTTDIRFPSGDGKRGGDFEMWFWLVEPLEVRMFILPSAITAGNKATGTLQLNRAAPPGGLVFKIDALNTGVTDPPQVVIPAGATEATFELKTFVGFVTTATVNVTAASGELSASDSLVVQDLKPNLNVTTPSLFRGEVSAGVVTLNRPAPVGGVKIQLTGSPAGELKITPASFTIPENGTTFQFSVEAIGSHNSDFNAAIKASFTVAPNISSEKLMLIRALAR